eukprot:CAMPEP_0184522682 /NCGR_PEP_ID=MMETSP0198_2-20121128/8419_1 /TAXON_ID=1112570 /ORGANISM="Thraustochytrium sp., Strain LLF1b" /LENGTH=618 /DNA_ID=CAMNT_0026913539 /DNA_START=685 /DNA_END=2541 /DNA_ORIENTATION=-
MTKPDAAADPALTTEAVATAPLSTTTTTTPETSQTQSKPQSEEAAETTATGGPATAQGTEEVVQPTSTPAKPLRLRPSLRGRLVRDEKTNQIKWEGSWGMDDSAFDGGVTGAFSYTRVHVVEDQASNNIPKDTVVEGLNEDGDSDVLSNALFSGYFNMLVNGKSKRISEKDILFEFCTDDILPEGSVKVVGSGTNQFGTYALEGSLILKTGELNVYREYKPLTGLPANRPRAPRSIVKPPRAKAAATPKRAKSPLAAAANSALAPVTPGDAIGGPTRQGRMRRTPSHLVQDALDDREAEDLIKLKNVVRELMRSDRDGWFAAPVNAEALGLRDYRDVITEPMDLGTVLRKFDHKEYTSHEAAIQDVRLTFNNAIKYNADGHGVNLAARRLLGQFEAQLQKLSANRASRKRKGSVSKGNKRPAKGEAKRPTHAAVFGESDDSDNNDSEDESDNGSAASGSGKDARSSGGAKKRRKSSNTAAVSSEVLMMKKQLEALNKQVKMMTDMQAAGFEMIQGQQFVNHISAPPAKPTHLRAAERPLSYQEKRQLGQDINKLPGDMIEGVIRIIQESGAPLGMEEDEEVELDIEALDTPALKKLQRYVKKSLSKARAKKGREDAIF